jgi:diguanylate cyclase (GGDEF)-like protein
VIVIRPDTDADVISGGGTSVLRAAVSVAVAAGNDRLWCDAPDADTVETSPRHLPEVVSAAADAAGVRSVHIGCVRRGRTVDAIAIWFETWNGVQPLGQRRLVLGALAEAAERASRRVVDPPPAVVVVEPAGPVARTFDPDDPSLDPLTGLATSDTFDEILADFEGDQATLVIADLDQFADVADEHGTEVADQVLRIIADRLHDHCGPNDRIARLGPDQFAVLFTEADRSSTMRSAKDLLRVIGEPLELTRGPDRVSATLALAHQIGLVDLEDMLDSATAAIRSGKRSGAGKLVLAA